MSQCRLVRWFRDLLFGANTVTQPPPELKDLLLQLEAEGVVWSDIILQGGLTGFSYNVHGDLNSLLEHIEHSWFVQNTPSLSFESNRLRTRVVSKFWTELQIHLARYLKSQPPVEVQQEDEAILKTLLSNGFAQSFPYQSAAFWGDVARRTLNFRRSVHDPIPALPSVPFDARTKLQQLYDITCQARGVHLDPYTLVLVPHSEHVNAVHWQSEGFLERFVRDRPSHPLSRSIQKLIQRSLDAFMQGDLPSALLEPSAFLKDFVQNIDNAHTSIPQISYPEPLPKVLDVFQRLLALTRKDALWVTDAKRDPAPPVEVKGLESLLLLEQLQITERQNALLWNLVKKTEYAQRRPERIYYVRGATDNRDDTAFDDPDEACDPDFPN